MYIDSFLSMAYLLTYSTCVLIQNVEAPGFQNITNFNVKQRKNDKLRTSILII